MKQISLISLFIIVLASCSSKTSKTLNLSDIEPTEEYSERMMPHLIDVDRTQFHFDDFTYNQIDSLLLVTLEIQKNEDVMVLDSEVFHSFVQRTEVLMNEMGELENDSHAILMEYSHPLRDLIEDLNASEGRDVLLKRVRDMQVYLLNFEQLFPRKTK